MAEYKSNSNKSRETVKPESRKIEKVENCEIIHKKKSFGDRFSTLIFQKSFVEMKEYLLDDILIPSLKDALSDLVRNGIDFMLFGDSRSSRNSKRGNGPYGSGTYINYSSLSTGRSADRASERRSSRVCKEIVLRDRGKAEEVLDRLLEAIDTYGDVSVGNFYELVGEPTEHTDYKYGWTNLGGASVVYSRGGWLIKLPRTEVLAN